MISQNLPWKNINERIENIKNLSNYVDFNNLMYRYNGNIKDKDFSNFIDTKTLFDSIKHKETKLADAVKNKKINSKIRGIKTGSKKLKKIAKK